MVFKLVVLHKKIPVFMSERFAAFKIINYNYLELLDYYTKKLTTESFLTLLLFAQLEEIESLHALDQLQKEIDLDSISISQLSRRFNGMNPDLFQRLFLVSVNHFLIEAKELVTDKAINSCTFSCSIKVNEALLQW